MSNSLGGKPTITNSILWGNNAPTAPEIHIASESSPAFTYCAIRGAGLWPGDGNINADPLFVDVAGGDLRLGRGSPCIDAGNNAAVPTGVTTDLNGWSRFIDDPCTTDTGSGTAPIVDMGAYEFMPADIDGSGVVNFSDFNILAAHWQASGGDCGGADVNCDGGVDIEDMAILAAYWLEGA